MASQKLKYLSLATKHKWFVEVKAKRAKVGVWNEKWVGYRGAKLLCGVPCGDVSCNKISWD